MTEFPNQRPYAALIREANGDRSRDEGTAAVNLAANSIVQLRAAVTGTPTAGQAYVLGTAVVNDAAVAALDTYSLRLSDGADIVEIDFAAAGINTLDEFKTALEALDIVDATVNVGGFVTITGVAGNPIVVDASNAAVFTGLGLTEGVTTVADSVPTVAGYVPYGTAGAIAGTAAYCPAEVAAGARGNFITGEATLKDKLLVVDEDLFDDAVADLLVNQIKVRETLVLN